MLKGAPRLAPWSPLGRSSGRPMTLKRSRWKRSSTRSGGPTSSGLRSANFCTLRRMNSARSVSDMMASERGGDVAVKVEQRADGGRVGPAQAAFVGEAELRAHHPGGGDASARAIHALGHL